MELYYNPEVMTEEELTQTFVARHALVDDLAALVKGQADGAGVQHVVLIAARGMGKTTVLLMLRLAIQAGQAGPDWQAVRFPEESYGVTSTTDFWLAALNYLAEETDDRELALAARGLPEQNREEDLGDAALALLKDWRRTHGKRLVLLVDNLDMLLEQINDEQENASLRQVLMNDGTLMLIGGATTFFREARDYDLPLYNFFRIFHLNDLKLPEIEDLLRQRAAVDGVKNFDEILRTNRARLRVLEYFTGGSPRLVLMLYRVITQTDISEVRRALEKLLDEVTPYYKAKVEVLPPQQRKILDQIARTSAETREGTTPTALAKSTRLPVSQVTAQLKRLANAGYVRAASSRGRNSYYVLAEPLYAIWHQMRFGRQARQKMGWLISFLKGWYSRDEIRLEGERLTGRFEVEVGAGSLPQARELLLFRMHLFEATDANEDRLQMADRLVRDCFALSDTEGVRTVAEQVDWDGLSPEAKLAVLKSAATTGDTKARDRLLQLELEAALESRDFETVALRAREAWDAAPGDVSMLRISAIATLAAGKNSEAAELLERSLNMIPNDQELSAYLAVALIRQGNQTAATDLAHRVLAMQPSSIDSLVLVLPILEFMLSAEQVLLRVDQELVNHKDNVGLMKRRANLATRLGRNDDVIQTCEQLARIEAVDEEVQDLWITSLISLHRFKEAWEQLGKIQETPGNLFLWQHRALVAAQLGYRKEYIESKNYLLRTEPVSMLTAVAIGLGAELLGNYDDSVEALELAIHLGAPRQNLAGALTRSLCNKLVSQGENFIDSPDLETWRKLLDLANSLDDPTEAVNKALVKLILDGHGKLAKLLIETSGLQERCFPLLQALKIATEGDGARLDRLSPEVKAVIKEIVAAIEQTSAKGEVG